MTAALRQTLICWRPTLWSHTSGMSGSWGEKQLNWYVIFNWLLSVLFHFISGRFTMVFLHGSFLFKKVNFYVLPLAMGMLFFQANLRSKVTHSMQTNLSHMRRDNVTQTYLLEDVACQSKRDGNSNVPKPQVYLAGLRGGKTKTTHMIKTNLTRSVNE